MKHEEPGPAPAERTVAGGSVGHITQQVRSQEFRRVLLVTGTKSFKWFDDEGLVGLLSSTALVERVSVKKPYPELSELTEGLKVSRFFQPDVVIGIGGGSVLDMAKLIASMIGADDTPADAIRLGAQFNRRRVALFLVPTTAGSGAEATHFAVLYKDGTKYSIKGHALCADYVVLDPGPLTTASRHQMAASGLDALSQCIESIWSRKQTETSARSATEGLHLISENLIAYCNGDYSRASDMQWGSHLSGQAINVSQTTGPHSLSYHLTAEYGVPHGIAVAATIGHFIDHHNGVVSRTPAAASSDLARSMGVINSILGTALPRSGQTHFSRVFNQLGLKEPDEYLPRDVDGLIRWSTSANPERRANHPTSYPKISGTWL